MARSTPMETTGSDQEVMTMTIELSSLNLITQPYDGTAHVTLELKDSLLQDVSLSLENTRVGFTVVDPVYGIVEHRAGEIQQHPLPYPVMRSLLDQVGVGLLKPDRD